MDRLFLTEDVFQDLVAKGSGIIYRPVDYRFIKNACLAGGKDVSLISARRNARFEFSEPPAICLRVRGDKRAVLARVHTMDAKRDWADRGHYKRYFITLYVKIEGLPFMFGTKFIDNV